MTGSTLDLVLISVVVVIVLAAWIVLVFYADAHPAWRWPGPPLGTARPLDCRSTARPAAHQETRTSPPGRDTAVPAANLPGGKPTAAARAPARAVPS
jgi:hypothetical protein